MHYFITGDRSMNPIDALNFLLVGLSSLDEQITTADTISTGNLETGVERAVRYLFPDPNIVHYSQTDEGYVDFTGTFSTLNTHTDRVLFIHSDPLASRVGTAIMQVFDPETVTILP